MERNRKVNSSRSESKHKTSSRKVGGQVQGLRTTSVISKHRCSPKIRVDTDVKRVTRNHFQCARPEQLNKLRCFALQKKARPGAARLRVQRTGQHESSSSSTGGDYKLCVPAGAMDGGPNVPGQ